MAGICETKGRIDAARLFTGLYVLQISGKNTKEWKILEKF